MARSFLFAQDSADAATTRLIAAAAEVTGFMKGEPGGSRQGWYQPGADNTALLTDMHAQLKVSYPSAGAGFYAVRLYTNLLWQPAYLAVIAAHIHGAMPDFSELGQKRIGIYFDGFALKPAAQLSGSVEERIASGGAQLKAMADVMLADVNQVVRIKPLPARRFLAGRMLALMVWLAQKRRDLSIETIETYKALWFDALGLTGQGDLEQVEAKGHRLLLVKRKDCCLDYRIEPHAYCATCPKQDNALRLERQTANALAELG